MDSIKVEVTGNIARVTDKPAVITSGTVGLQAEFTFDSEWEGLRKTAIFAACDEKRAVDNIESEVTVPWEVLQKPGVWLTVGVYGENDDGTTVIPTVWANVCVIKPGATTEGDPGADPTLTIWQQLRAEIEAVRQELEAAPSAAITEVTLKASNWEGDASPYSQVVAIAGVTAYSQVDLTPSAEQLSAFYYKDLAFVTENDGGVVTVYAIGQKPENDYTIQVTITEVDV